MGASFSGCCHFVDHSYIFFLCFIKLIEDFFEIFLTFSFSGMGGLAFKHRAETMEPPSSEQMYDPPKLAGATSAHPSVGGLVPLPALGTPSEQLGGLASAPMHPEEMFPSTDGAGTSRSPRPPGGSARAAPRDDGAGRARARKYKASKAPTKRGTATRSYQDTATFEKIVPGEL